MSLLEYTCEDARMGMQKLAPAIERYANLVVRKGVNVKPGQEVVVQVPLNARSLPACWSSARTPRALAT